MSDVETLSCQELVELVTDYLEGALSERDRRAFDEHIAGCAGCTEFLAQLRVTIEIAGTITPDDLSPEAETALLHAFRDFARAS